MLTSTFMNPIGTLMGKQVSPRSKSEVPMDVVSSHSSGTSPIVHYELPTDGAPEAKLVV